MGKDTFIGKNKRPWPNKRLKRAAIVGHTDASSTRLWFRTASTGTFIALIYERPKRDDSIYGNFNNVPYNLDLLPNEVRQEVFSINNWDTDSTHVLDIDNLKPGTEYGYALYSENDEKIILGHDKPHFFRTLPENDKAFSFAFYSCHMPYKKSFFGRTKLKNEEMWDFFLAALNRHYKHDLRFVIGGGDQVYCDGIETLSIWEFLNTRLRKDPQTGELLPAEEDMLSWYRDIYRGYWGFEAVREVFSTFPTYMMWDDHELCDGWGSYFTDTEEDLYSILPKLKDRALTLDDGKEIMNRMERAAKQAYMEYQHSHNPKTDPGKWDYDFYHGDCAFYLLDGRGYRDVNRDSYRILGKEQFDRFKNWLESDETKNKQFLFVLAAVP
ncbi:MAG: alkaline phosphatase D family protein, partial [Candidatus Brocadiales bacterium]